MEKKTLYHKGKQGELRVWTVWTEDDKIKTEYGVLNGEMQISVKKATPKNIGKKNETTAAQQAELEAEALYKFKLDRKYSTTQESAQEPLLLPMLAKDNLKKLTFPCYVQPKLDGVRCLAFWEGDRIKLISRSGREWTVPKHINEQLAEILPEGCMFDGELYIHGKSCQTITSYVNKWRNEETPTIEYHIYDAPIIVDYQSSAELLEEEPYENRLAFLRDIEYNVYDSHEHYNITFVETNLASTPEEVKAFESKCVEDGYEGAIARNKDGLYIFGYRSDDLIKIKTFQDDEYEVTDCRDGVGKFEGCAVFACRNNTSISEEELQAVLKERPDVKWLKHTDGLLYLIFECTLATTMKEKAMMFAEKDSYIGRKLTVKFQGFTDLKLPRFPTGKVFRPVEDLQ